MENLISSLSHGRIKRPIVLQTCWVLLTWLSPSGFIPSLLVGYGSNPSQYWGKLTFTECELLPPVCCIYIICLPVSLFLCYSLFAEQNTLLRLRHSALMSAYFAVALWPPHIYKSIKGEGAKIFYPQWRLKSSKLIMGTKNPGSGWWRWEPKMQSVVDTRLKGQHFLILPNPNYRV